MSGTEPDEGMAVDEDKPEDGEAGGIYIQYVTVCMKYLAFYTHAGSWYQICMWWLLMLIPFFPYFLPLNYIQVPFCKSFEHYECKIVLFVCFYVDDDKPKYTCEMCGKSYIRSWSYYGHMREHASGEKQHKCDVCEKVFNYASNLRQHMLIHTGKFIKRPGRES